MAFFSVNRVACCWHSWRRKRRILKSVKPVAQLESETWKSWGYPMSPSIASPLETVVAQHEDDFSGCIPRSAHAISISKHVPSTEVWNSPSKRAFLQHKCGWSFFTGDKWEGTEWLWNDWTALDDQINSLGWFPFVSPRMGAHKPTYTFQFPFQSCDKILWQKQLVEGRVYLVYASMCRSWWKEARAVLEAGTTEKQECLARSLAHSQAPF